MDLLTSDVREIDREGVFISICKLLFVTLIVNKKENTVCITSVCFENTCSLRDRHVKSSFRNIIRASPKRYISKASLCCFPSLVFIRAFFLVQAFLRSRLARRVSHAAAIASVALYNFYVAIVTVDVKEKRSPFLGRSAKKI